MQRTTETTRRFAACVRFDITQGLALRSTSVLTAESATAYTLQVSTTGSEGPSQEKLAARRVGDCKP